MRVTGPSVGLVAVSRTERTPGQKCTFVKILEGDFERFQRLPFSQRVRAVG